MGCHRQLVHHVAYCPIHTRSGIISPPEKADTMSQWMLSLGVIVDQDVKLDENGLPQTDLTDKQDRQFRYVW
jgi:hypothetical protein